METGNSLPRKRNASLEASQLLALLLTSLGMARSELRQRGVELTAEAGSCEITLRCRIVGVAHDAREITLTSNLV